MGWVTDIADWHIERVFLRLREQVEKDVAERNEVNDVPSLTDRVFDFAGRYDDRFRVGIRHNTQLAGRVALAFQRDDTKGRIVIMGPTDENRIEIESDKASGKLTMHSLDADGKVTASRELDGDVDVVSRMALQELFFGF